MSCKKSCGTSWFRRTCGGSWLQYAPVYALLLAAALVVLLCFKCCGGKSTAAPPEATASPTVHALMYHHLLPDAAGSVYAGNNIVTDVAAFEQQLVWLRDNGWQSVTLQQLREFLHGDVLPQKSVLITFDDGYLSNAVYAAPLLRQYGFTATVFLVTGELEDTPSPFCRAALQSLDRQTLAACADVFTYALHTHQMHTLTGNGASRLTDASAEQLAADLASARTALADVPGGDLAAISYPYGFHTQRLVTELGENGINMGFLAYNGDITPQTDSMRLPRCQVDSSVSMAAFADFFV